IGPLLSRPLPLDKAAPILILIVFASVLFEIALKQRQVSRQHAAIASFQSQMADADQNRYQPKAFDLAESMRGSDLRTGELFSYVDLEQRVPESHPLRLIRCIVNQVIAALDGEFGKLYAAEGRPSIAPERLLRALLLQAFYSIRSERQLMEQLHYNLLYRWFVGLGVDDRVWVPTVFTKNRDRL